MEKKDELTLHPVGVSQAVTLTIVKCQVGECRICSSPEKVVRGKFKHTLRTRGMAHTAWSCSKKKCKEMMLRKLIKLLARDSLYTKKQIEMMLRQP